jgi:ribosomal protein S18 acetylase RimI-like enzyme
MTVSIRNARPSDIQAIADLEASLYGAEGYGNYAIRQFIDMFPDSFFVSQGEAALTGYALVGVKAASKMAWILSICVEKASQGQGIGRALIGRCIAYCTKNGFEVCALTVAPDNSSAVHLYESLGFSVTERVRDYYRAGDSRLVMTRTWPNS